MSDDDSYIVYLLSTCEAPYQTYVGMTNNKERRLKQHNGILSGGARATSRRKGEWKRVLYVSGFPDKITALQFEWAWKYWTRKQPAGMTPLDRRQKALEDLLSQEQATSKAIPFSSFPHPLEINYEDDSGGGQS